MSIATSAEKIVAIILTLIVQIAGGIVPVQSKTFRLNPNFVSIANCFCGGIFFGITLITLLPDAFIMYLLNQGEEIPNSRNFFPWVFMMCLLSYSMLLISEKVLFQDNKKIGVSLKEQLFQWFMTQYAKSAGSSQNPLQENGYQKCLLGDQDNKTSSFISEIQVLQVKKGNDQFFHRNLIKNRKNSSEEKSENDGNDIYQGDQNESGKSLYKDVFILIMLSFNSLFEGLVIGLQNTSATIVILFLTTLFYNLIVSISLTVYLVNEKFQKQNIMFFTITYSCMCTIGIGIGWLLEYLQHEVNCLAQAFSCGVLLYISTIIIVAEEFKQLYMKWVKIVIYLIGIAITVILWLLEREVQK